jgi:hypothetical protein
MKPSIHAATNSFRLKPGKFTLNLKFQWWRGKGFCNWYCEAVFTVVLCSILESCASQQTINVFTAGGSYNHTLHNLSSPEARPVSSAHCPVTPNKIARIGGANLTIAEAIVLPTSKHFSVQVLPVHFTHKNKQNDGFFNMHKYLCSIFLVHSVLVLPSFVGAIQR